MRQSIILFIVAVAITTLGCDDSQPKLAEAPQVDGDSNVAFSSRTPSFDGMASIELLALKKNQPVEDAFFWLAVEDEADLVGLDSIEKKPQPAVIAEEDGFAPRCLVVHGDQIVFRTQNRAANIGYTDQVWSMNIQPWGEVSQKVEVNRFPGRIYNDLIKNYGDGYLLVLNHAFGAVTKEDGIVKIPGIPRGKFKVRVWHPELGFPDSIAFGPGFAKQEMDRGKYEIELTADARKFQVSW